MGVEGPGLRPYAPELEDVPEDRNQGLSRPPWRFQPAGKDCWLADPLPAPNSPPPMSLARTTIRPTGPGAISKGGQVGANSRGCQQVCIIVLCIKKGRTSSRTGQGATSRGDQIQANGRED